MAFSPLLRGVGRTRAARFRKLGPRFGAVERENRHKAFKLMVPALLNVGAVMLSGCSAVVACCTCKNRHTLVYLDVDPVLGAETFDL